MNKAHEKQIAERKEARAEKIETDFWKARKEFLHKSYLGTWGLTYTQIEIMWQGQGDNGISLPENWDWEKFYKWENEIMGEWDYKNKR